MKVRIPQKMTKEQNKAMNDEINRQIVESDRKFALENDAMVLWVMHIVFKFGKKRLKRYFDRCFQEHEDLRNFFQFDNDDMGWLYTRQLKEIGVDIEEWYREKIPDFDKNK